MANALITAQNSVFGIFLPEMVGGNLSPWGYYWPSTSYDALLQGSGIGALRHGHATNFMVDMNVWGEGGVPPFNYNTTGLLDQQASSNYGDGTFSFNNQGDWLADVGLPVMWTASDELSYEMRSSATALNLSRVAPAWVDVVNFWLNKGVNIQWIEIGNECEIAPQEGIQIPPVTNSSGHGAENPNYIDPEQPESAANNYITLWESVVAAMRQAHPEIPIGAYAAGQGPTKTRYFPFSYLFNSATQVPDFYAWHHYPMPGSGTAQQVMDSTWQYYKMYNEWEPAVETVREALIAIGAPSDIPIYLTEYNYDSSTRYSGDDTIQFALYTLSVMLNAHKGGTNGCFFWDTFCGSNTGGAIAPDYELRYTAQGHALRYMSLFTNRDVYPHTFSWTSGSDNSPGTPGGLTAPRVECMITKNLSSYLILLLNKNNTQAHSVSLDLSALGLGSQSVAAKVYSTLTAVRNDTPTTSTPSLSGGTLNSFSLPAASFAILEISTGVSSPALSIDMNLGHVNRIRVR